MGEIAASARDCYGVSAERCLRVRIDGEDRGGISIRNQVDPSRVYRVRGTTDC